MIARLWHRLRRWLAWSLPAVARGGTDLQKVGLEYKQAPAQAWFIGTLSKAALGLSLDLVLEQAGR